MSRTEPHRASNSPPSAQAGLADPATTDPIEALYDRGVTDGTPDKYLEMEYVAVAGRAKALLAGWKQFGEDVKAAAWKTIPSWYIVFTQDNAINPDLERFMAKRIGAQTREIRASHVGFISQPAEIAKVIEAAAGAK